MKVKEDFDSGHTKRSQQEWNEQKLPKALLGHCGGRLPGRSTEEKGRERLAVVSSGSVEGAEG